MGRAGRPVDNRKDMILTAFGSNLPFCGLPPADIITSALRALQNFATILARSRLYESPAWPDPTDPPFVNAVACIETGLGPEALLAAFHAVEAAYGRRRGPANAPRSLDLDLLDYDGLVREADKAGTLILPHPRLSGRDFVLLPLAEVAPGWTHPLLGETVETLLTRLGETGARPLAAR